MNILLFIYIFSLFVITAPNVLFKIPRNYGLGITMLHAIVFTSILYFTYDIVSTPLIEGGSYRAKLEIKGINITPLIADEATQNAADEATQNASDAATAKTAADAATAKTAADAATAKTAADAATAKTAADAATAKTAADAANNAAKEAENVNKKALGYVQDRYQNELDNAYKSADANAKQKEATRDNNPNKYKRGAFGGQYATQEYISQIDDAATARNYANILKAPKDLADALTKASQSVLQAADSVSTSAKSVASYAESILKRTTPAERAATIKDKASAAKTIADTAKADADKVVTDANKVMTDADKAITDATANKTLQNYPRLNESKNLSYHLLSASGSVAGAALKVSAAAESVTEAATSFK